jgi:HSP20 family protein
MTAPRAWDPLKELIGIQRRMNQLFDGALAKGDVGAQGEIETWAPASDVYLLPDALVFCLELPGFEQHQIDLRLEGDDLVVSGAREMEREQAGERFHRVERPYGRFSRRFRLPSTVDRNGVQAAFRDGVLRVSLPHTEPVHAPPIRVTID